MGLPRSVEMSMVKKRDIVLHRDDPEKNPLPGNVKVTREDWINVGRDMLVSDGVAEVKVLAIADRMNVSRSSFYWYFRSRKDLLDALIEDWETKNTKTLVEHCRMEAGTITEAVCNFFRCFVDPDLFDQRLDFAIREWARNDGHVRRRLDRADGERLKALTAMFVRHGYSEYEADVRARILYFMQLGYHALDHTEPLVDRLARVEGYLLGFTGVRPASAEVEALRAYALKRAARS